MPHSAIAVFTSKTLETLLAHGGSGPWVGAEQRVQQQKFLVCVRKERPGAESHGGAFFADNRLTIADLKALVILRWVSSGLLDHIPTDLVATVAPKLKAYMERIGNTPVIEQYYEQRTKGG